MFAELVLLLSMVYSGDLVFKPIPAMFEVTKDEFCAGLRAERPPARPTAVSRHWPPVDPALWPKACFRFIGPITRHTQVGQLGHVL